MKIVKFKDGRYAIRRGNWLVGYEFMSVSDDFWWSLPKCVERYCKTNDLEMLQENIFFDRGKPL